MSFRSLILFLAVTTITLLGTQAANAVPEIGFATGVRMPSECEAVPLPDPAGTPGTLDCTAPLGTVLTFSVIITVGTGGMQGYSFGAKWDDDNQAELTNVSAKQAFSDTLYVSKTPPLYSVAFSPDNGARSAIAGITQSTPSSPGTLVNWTAISSSPDSALYLGSVLDGASYRAGRISVTVSTGNAGSVVQLGFFDPDKDSFLKAGGAEVTPDFTSGIAHINTITSIDNCPGIENPTQADSDSDGQGDACDEDDDNDGMRDTLEASLGTSPVLSDTDGDGLVDVIEVGLGTDPLDPESHASSP